MKKGSKMSEESKEKMRLARKGKKKPHAGVPHSEETRRKMSKTRLGVRRSEEAKKNISEAKKGSKNGTWKGDEVSYSGLHRWIRRNLGKANRCDNPKCVYPRLSALGKMMLAPKRFHWANKSGKYLRDISDWWQLCQSCNARDGVRISERFKEEMQKQKIADQRRVKI